MTQTDKEKFIALFESVGVFPKTDSVFFEQGKNLLELRVDDEDNLKVDGYLGFLVQFTFDKDDKFVAILIYE